MTTMRCLQPPQGAAADAALNHRASVPVLETARLRLRAPKLEDVTLWTKINQSGDPEFLGGPHSDADCYADFCVYSANWMLHGHGLWSVERKDTGALIGFVTLGFEWGDLEPELGYLFDVSAHGQGYAREAAEAALAHALDIYGPGGVISYISEGNLPSQRLATRLGATRDADAETEIDNKAQVWRHGVSS